MTARKVWAMTDDVKETDTVKQFDAILHPLHYCAGDVECIDAMLSAFGADMVRDFCYLNAFKYLWRSPNKNGDDDLRKARWYIDKCLELGEKPER